MSEPITFSSLLDDARKRRDRIDTAVSAFRELPFEEQLQFLVTVEDEIVVASGAAGAVLSLGAAGKQPALPPAPVIEPEPSVQLGPAIATPSASAPAPDNRRSRYGPEAAARVAALFDQGHSQGEICKLVNMSYPTVNKMLRAAGRNTSARTSRRPPAKPGSADPEDSHPVPIPLPRPSRSQAGEPRPQRVARPNPRPLHGGPGPHRLLGSAEELDLARQLEELEIGAWERVLGTPEIAGNLEIADEVRRLTEQRTGVPAVAIINAQTLRRADPNRKTLDTIVAIVRSNPTTPTIANEIRDELVTQAADAHAIRHHFVSCNIRLVGKISQKFFWTKLDHDDLMQEGMFGLMHAVGIYDHRRALRFSTYATWWIKHFMLRSWENSAEVRIPVHINGMRSKIFSATKRLKKELRREPTEAEIAAAAGMTLAALRKTGGPGWWLTGAPKSFDYEVSEDGSTLADHFADPASEVTPVHQMISAENIELVTNALAQLDERDAEIVRRRFGIGCEPEILADVGVAFGVSRERIRQLEKAALEGLRHALARTMGIGRNRDTKPRRSILA